MKFRDVLRKLGFIAPEQDVTDREWLLKNVDRDNLFLVSKVVNSCEDVKTDKKKEQKQIGVAMPS